MTRRFALPALLMVCVLSAATFAPAAEDYLKLVPEEAWGVFAVNNPAALDAKLQTFARQMQIPMPGLFAMIEHQGLRKGWDEKGTAAFVVLPPTIESRPPTPLILVPVVDFDKFLAVFESAEKQPDEPVYKVVGFHAVSYVRHIGGYAAITDPMHREVISEKNLKLANEVPASLAAWRQWLAGHDAAGVILPPGIKFISSNVQKGLQAAQTMMARNPQAKSMAPVFEIYGKILQSAEREVAGFGISADLDQQNNVILSKRVLLVPGGKWAELVGKTKPARMNLLAGLPEGPFALAGGCALSEEMTVELMKFSMDMMKNMREIYGLSEEQIDKMSDLWKDSMTDIRAMSMLVQVGQSDEPLYSKMAFLTRVDDSRKFMTGYESILKRYAELVKGIDSPMFRPIEIEKTEVGGISGLQFSMEMPQSPGNMPSPQYEQMMKLMFGPERKLNAWIVPADEHTVVVGYVNQQLLQRMIEAVKQGKPGLVGMAEVKQTAALLPSDAVAVGYLSPTGLLNFIKQVVPAFAPPGANPTFPEFPEMPAIGFAVTTAPNEIQSRMVVPGEVIQTIIQTMMKYQHSPQGEFKP